MTLTALALKKRRMDGRGRHIEADTAVTLGTEFILRTGQQPRSRGVVKHMTGAALLLLHRRMLHPGICRGIGMAFNTHLTLRGAQEIVGPCRSLMRGVAFEAVAYTGIGVVCTPLIQIRMTSEAQIALFAFQERSAVACMRHMTRGAVSLHYGGMAASLTCLILYSGVAAQAQALLRCLERERSPLMAGGTFAFCYRGMHGGAPQRGLTTPMGIVTFGAAGRGYPSVCRAHRCGRVAAGTHGAFLLMEKFGRRTAMGRMAGATTLGYG